MASWTCTVVSAVTMVFLTVNAASEKGWMSVPVTGPVDLLEDVSNQYYYAPIWIGNPPQIHHLAIGLYSVPVYLFNPDCPFCPANNSYNPLISSTFKPVDSETWPWNAPQLKANVATDDISIEGVLMSNSQEFGLVNQFNAQSIYRFNEGLLGLALKPLNETRNRYNILYNLHKSGKLLNPVIGMKLGGSNPRLTIGALDPNDYEGEINWVERVPSISGFETIVPVEAVRGRAGRILPFSYPLNAVLSTLDQDIYLPDTSQYFRNDSYIGPQSLVEAYANRPQGYGVKCNITLENRNFDELHIPFSIDINGVNYPVDSKDLIRPQSYISSNDSCRIGLFNSTSEDGLSMLGFTFLRSIYLAYRFPTEDCPNGYFGFAYPAGANRTSVTISQKPRTTPPLASQCLQLVAPTSTLSPKQASFAVKHQNEQFDFGASETTFKVWGRPDEAQTPLIGVEDLPQMAVGAKKTSPTWW